MLTALRPFRVVVATSFVLMLLLVSLGTASARGVGPHRTTITPLSVSCSGTQCNGKDPYGSGCANTAYPQGNETSILAGSAVIGTVQIYWSTQCQTNWAEVRATYGGQPATASKIEAQIVGLNRLTYWWASCTNCQAYHSQMYYAPNESVEADGYVYLQGGANNTDCQTQGTGCTYTTTGFPH